MMATRKHSKSLIVTGRNVSPALEKALDGLGHTDGIIEKIPASIAAFPSGESFAELFFGDEDQYDQNAEKLKGANLIIVQSVSAPVAGSAMELLLAVTTAKRYGAASVTAVMPFAAFARQDREFERRFASVAAEDFAKLLKAAGADQIVTVDLHSKAAEAFYKKHFGADKAHFLSTARLTAEKLAGKTGDKTKIVIGAPDGADKPHDRGQVRAAAVAKAAGLPEKGALFKIWKEHTGVNATKINRFEGDVAGKDCIVIDDMTDSGGTLKNAARLLKKNGAKTVTCYVTHGLFSGNALERLVTDRIAGGSYTIDRLAVSDTAPDVLKKLDRLKAQYPGLEKRVTVLSTADLIADKIKSLHGAEQKPQAQKTNGLKRD